MQQNEFKCVIIYRANCVIDFTGVSDESKTVANSPTTCLSKVLYSDS